MVHVVSEQTEVDLAKRCALQDLRWALRELGANMLRVIRGAGRSAEIGSQATTLLKAFEAYRAATGLWPSSYEIDRCLDLVEWSDDGWPVRGGDTEEAYHTMMRGGLQMAASKLLHQQTQVAAGRSEIFDGMREFEDAIKKIHAEPRPRPDEAELRALVASNAVAPVTKTRTKAAPKPRKLRKQ